MAQDKDMSYVNEMILPISAIEKAHLEVYDARAAADVLPYRVCRQDINHPMYHRSLYLAVTGAHVGNMKVRNCDLETLFTVRKRNNWEGNDSLYDAWLMSNFGISRPRLDTARFTETYPDWKNKMKAVNLGELIAKEVQDVTVTSKKKVVGKQDNVNMDVMTTIDDVIKEVKIEEVMGKRRRL